MKIIDVVKAIKGKVGLDEKKTEMVIRTAFDHIGEYFVREAQGSLLVPGFAVFKSAVRKARRNRNPFTGELRTIPAKRTVSFKASATLTRRLNSK